MAARDLCSASDVFAELKITDPSEAETAYMERVVSAVSTSIHRISGREFKPYREQPETRTFYVRGYPRVSTVSPSRDVKVGDLAVLDAISVDATVVAPTYFDDVVLLPTSRSDDEPIRRLRFPNGVGLFTRSRVDVTGTFGWPAVPEDVRDAAIAGSAFKFERDVARWSDTFRAAAETGDVANVDSDLPSGVYSLALGYKSRAI